LFPEHRQAIANYFATLTRINAELMQAPLALGPSFLLRPWKFWNVIRYRNWTIDDLFNRLGLPPRLRSILAGQSGDLLVPPSRASLLIHSALVCGYDSGAWVPTQSYSHLFSALVDFINAQAGCQVLLRNWVSRLEERDGRIVAARTRKGVVYEAERFLFNGDPRLLPGLLSRPLPRRFAPRLTYQ